MIIAIPLNAQRVKVPKASSQNNNAVLLDTTLFLLSSFLFDSEEEVIPQFYDGEIQLKDGDIFLGEVSVNFENDNEYSTIVKTIFGEELLIPNTDISKVVLYDYNEDGSLSETQFEVLNDTNRLYRELYRKNENVIAYDLGNRPFCGKLKNDVYIKQNDDLIDTWNFWASSPRRGLLKYLSERDGQKYKPRDYKSIQAIFAML